MLVVVLLYFWPEKKKWVIHWIYAVLAWLRTCGREKKERSVVKDGTQIAAHTHTQSKYVCSSDNRDREPLVAMYFFFSLLLSLFSIRV